MRAVLAMAAVRADAVAVVAEVVRWAGVLAAAPAAWQVEEVAAVQVLCAPAAAVQGCQQAVASARRPVEAAVECRRTEEEAAWLNEAKAVASMHCSAAGRCRSVWVWRRAERRERVAGLRASEVRLLG